MDGEPAINVMVPFLHAPNHMQLHQIIFRLCFLLIPVAVVVMRRIRHVQTVELVYPALHAEVTVTIRSSILVGSNANPATKNRFVIVF